MPKVKFSSATAIERLPPVIRGLLGCGAGFLATGLTYAIAPLRSFPMLLAFPAVILGSWFLGMSGGVLCALTEAILINWFLNISLFRLTIGSSREGVRLSIFFVITILLAWTIRRLAQQRALLDTRDLQQRLSLANAERQLAEERARASEALRDREDVLQLAFRANGMGLWMWDLIKDVVHWSDEVYRIAGREPGCFKPDSDVWFSLIHPEDAEAVQEACGRARSAGEDYRIEYRVMWPDGSFRWIESQGRCQLDDEGRPARLVGLLSDVTRRKQAEEAMLRAEKLAVVGRLAASVAHEINNPLEAVTNLLFLITLTDKMEDAQMYARSAMDELMRVSLITQQTLKFNRQPGTPKVVQLSELIEAVLVLFRGKLRATQIAPEVRVEQEPGVSCLPGETQQIFANLVSNAIDAMPNGGRLVVRVRASCDWRDGKTTGVRATFCDSGVGMDRETIRRIFEPFFTTKTETGTGLGMWVVAQLLERQHGHIRVWSTRRAGGGGTAFSVFLPAEQVPLAATEMSPSEISPSLQAAG
jgi:PAS domain S-box-containing protein